ncbi:MAG: chemotaxis-specific protein-glutamate methyltransferase CheB [Phycisphaerales bacterium]
MADRTRVLIVDDSRLFRAALEEALAGQPEIQVVGSVFSGEKALEAIKVSPPDFVTLDVEMPGLDGLATLRQIQQLGAADPRFASIGVLILSAHTRHGTETSIRALAAGAFDVVAKPSTESATESVAQLRAEIVPRVRAFAQRKRFVPASTTYVPPPRRAIAGSRAPRCIVIGASTGGPRALCSVLPPLCAATRLPILIVQHMPQGFTASLAASLARESNARIVEATDGASLASAAVFIAPGGQHLVVRGTAELPLLGLNAQPPENGCRPAADVLFRSAAAVFGGAVVAVVLTGMGRDGTAGAGAIRRAGGYVIAQDEATSVVWGMPGSAVEAAVVDEVAPLSNVAAAITNAIRRAT